MNKKDVAVLDFGSSTITALIGERGVNGTFRMKGKGYADYAGFQNGEFLEPDQVKLAVAFAISNAEMEYGYKINEIYVGVPGEFSNVVCRDSRTNFGRRKKIGENELKLFYQQANIYKKHPTHSVINQCPIFFSLDDGKRIIDPVGMSSASLRGFVSFVLAENNFIDFVDGILSELQVKRAGFISSCLAEMLYLFDPTVRDRYALLVDCGYITTNVMLGRGDGLLFMNSFSMGGGHISGDLAQCLKIPFSEAESLKRKIIFSWNASDSDTYEIQGKEFISPFSAVATNQIAEDRVEMICTYILKCIERCEFEFPDYIPVFLTGGGLCYIKGIKDIMSRMLGRRVEIVKPSGPNMGRPEFSTELGLLDVALSCEENENCLIVK